MPILRALLLVALAIPIVALAEENARWSGWCRYEWDTNQPPPPRLNLPEWVCTSEHAKKLAEKYTPHTRINPFYLTGDFDGDGKTDIAIWVKNIKTKEIGLAILHHGDKSLHILGAGTLVKDRGRNLGSFDMWSLYPKAPISQSPYEGQPPNLKGDALWVAKSESASVFIYWSGSHYSWYQEGD